MITARSTMFRSSRMLSGHEYRCSAAMSSGPMKSTCLPHAGRELLDESPHQLSYGTH